MDNFGATEAGIFITISNLVKQMDMEVEVDQLNMTVFFYT